MFGAHAQVLELGLLVSRLVEGSQGLLSLNNEVSNQGSILDSRHLDRIVREVLHWNTIKVNYHIADSARVLHQLIKHFLDLVFVVCLSNFISYKTDTYHFYFQIKLIYY